MELLQGSAVAVPWQSHHIGEEEVEEGAAAAATGGETNYGGVRPNVTLSLHNSCSLSTLEAPLTWKVKLTVNRFSAEQQRLNAQQPDSRIASDDAGYESLQQHQEAFRKQQNALGIDSSKN